MRRHRLGLSSSAPLTLIQTLRPSIALWHSLPAATFHAVTFEEGCSYAEPLVRKAVAIDGNDAVARARLALVLFLKGDLEGAIQEADHALVINPNCADAFGAKGASLNRSSR
jgi:adenylate cyclase